MTETYYLSDVWVLYQHEWHKKQKPILAVLYYDFRVAWQNLAEKKQKQNSTKTSPNSDLEMLWLTIKKLNTNFYNMINT